MAKDPSLPPEVKKFLADRADTFLCMLGGSRDTLAVASSSSDTIEPAVDLAELWMLCCQHVGAGHSDVILRVARMCDALRSEDEFVRFLSHFCQEEQCGGSDRTLKVSIMSPLMARKRCRQYPRPLWCFLVLKHVFIIKKKGIDVSNQIRDLPAIDSSLASWIALAVSPPACVPAIQPAPARVPAIQPAPARAGTAIQPAAACVSATLPAAARAGMAILPVVPGMDLPPASRGT
ncbi:uncharacterized protein LOC135825789 isoform X2 [Sycon ciliatum]|uniref:uncharacterized protein LOC135825789 isoform X2 n=1 Tax=Sycon ciliatum TaxID=27933 RepID=UPI0031F69A6E